MTKTATFVKDVSAYFNGTAHLFKVSPAVPYSWNHDSKAYDGETEYIVASAVTGWAYETYLFPADENGSVIDWGELDGSQKGTTDIQSVMSEAGYSVA